jgi:hypothetical protein
MNCTEYEELLQPYLDAELDGLRRRAMQGHGKRCCRCAEALDEYQVLFRVLDRMERECAPAGIEAAVLSRLPRASVGFAASRPGLASRWVRPRWLGLALAGALGLALLGAACVSPSLWGARLGTLATWWYAWVGDLLGTVAWLRESSVAELEQAAAALLRAAALLLRAGAVHLLLFWTLATVTGLWLSTRQRAASHVVRHS